MKALLSIKPEYVDRILSGEKKFEFRRRIFKRPDIDTIVIYATLPVGKVVAEVGIAGVMESTPEDIWERTHEEGGISEARFMDYFRGRDMAYAIRLGSVRVFDDPLPLPDYAPGVARAPQSFAYISDSDVF